MKKALIQIQEKQSLVDLFIIVLDARAPLSSYNVEFDQIAPHKPRLFVINKLDLADRRKIPAILEKFNHEKDAAIAVSLKNNNDIKKIIRESEKLLETKRQKDFKKGILKPRLRAFVCGVPNSGKSTLINSLANKRSARVGNMPGVTKGQQWINAGNMQLLDTPGILWPKFSDELIGVKLAIIGSIKTSIIPKQELYYAGYKLLGKYYPTILQKYGLEPLKDETKMYSALSQIAKHNNFLQEKGQPNIDKALSWFLNMLRDLKGVTYD